MLFFRRRCCDVVVAPVPTATSFVLIRVTTGLAADTPPIFESFRKFDRFVGSIIRSLRPPHSDFFLFGFRRPVGCFQVHLSSSSSRLHLTLYFEGQDMNAADMAASAAALQQQIQEAVAAAAHAAVPAVPVAHVAVKLPTSG